MKGTQIEAFSGLPRSPKRHHVDPHYLGAPHLRRYIVEMRGDGERVSRSKPMCWSAAADLARDLERAGYPARVLTLTVKR